MLSGRPGAAPFSAAGPRSACGSLNALVMRTQSPDTDAEAEAIQIEGYRRMAPADKMRIVEDLNRAVRELAAARIRSRYGPDLPDRELRLRLAALWLDRVTMIGAFGWDPEAKGY